MLGPRNCLISRVTTLSYKLHMGSLLHKLLLLAVVVRLRESRGNPLLLDVLHCLVLKAFNFEMAIKSLFSSTKGDAEVAHGYGTNGSSDEGEHVQGSRSRLKPFKAFLTSKSIAGEEGIYRVSSARKQIGVTSAIFLIFNRMIGTGIFATPSAIFGLSGSVGLALFIWVAGMLIALAGMLTYLEFGTGLPRNGGEKNYLEYVYRKPKFLATGMYAGYVVLLGWAGGNSVVFGEFILHAARVEVDRWNQRAVGLAWYVDSKLVFSGEILTGIVSRAPSSYMVWH